MTGLRPSRRAGEGSRTETLAREIRYREAAQAGLRGEGHQASQERRIRNQIRM